MRVDEEKLFLGASIPFYDLFMIKQPRIRDIIGLGKFLYNYYVNLLTISEGDIFEISKKEAVISTDPLTYLLNKCENDDLFLLEFKKALTTFIMVDIKEIRVLPSLKMIQVGEDFRSVLNEKNFKEFQNIIRLLNNIDQINPPPENENEMQKKFRLRREETERAKKKQAKQSGDGIDFLDILSSLVVGQIIPYSEIEDLPIYAFHSLFARYQAKLTYEMDIDALLAGADSKKIKPRHWFLKNK